jgi:mRNA interferase MazF
MSRRGDVVIAEFPFAGGGGIKNRPAIVVQCDRLNNKLLDTVVVMVTGNLRFVGKEASQFLIDPATPEGQASGLHKASAVRCESLLTIPQADILQTIGHLSDPLKQRLNASLRSALELP